MSIPGTVQVSGPIAPTALTDTYPTHSANYGQGGAMQVADATARNAISSFRRVEGMIATTQSDGNTWRLLAPPWSYTDTDWTSFGASTSGDVGYTNTNPATIGVGGIPAGTTFPAGTTVAQVFDEMFYPYQPPGFGGFGMSGVPGSVEVGYTIAASQTFTWSTSQSANVAANSISINDVSGSHALGTGLANNGTYAVVMPASIQQTTSTSYSFSISGTNTHSGTFSGGFGVSWYWKLFYGTNTNPTLSAGDVAALSGSGLAGGYGGTYNFSAGGYKYICFPNEGGGQINSIKDTSNGFGIAMASVADNAAYSHVDGGGFSYSLVTGTNTYGVAVNFRVYRSRFVLGGSIQMQIA